MVLLLVRRLEKVVSLLVGLLRAHKALVALLAKSRTVAGEEQLL
jgi:hypothetical protein